MRLRQANRDHRLQSKFVAPLPLTLEAGRREGRKYRRNAMRKTYLIATILLLSAVWATAQTTPQSTTPGGSTAPATSPQSTSPSQQPAAPDASQTSTDSGNSIEGCLSGSAGNFTLTDAAGKSWQLAGDTAKLGDHVGHQVRISGESASSPSSGAGASAGAGAGASGAPATFTVKKVKMISSSCPTSK